MQEENKQIIGSGGGGGKGGGGAARVAVEDPNTLRSKEYARVLDLVSEGEIGGLVYGFQSVYYDGVPLQNADGSMNFKDVLVDIRTGTQNQDIIGDLSGVENPTSVNVKILANLASFPATTGTNLTLTREAHGFSVGNTPTLINYSSTLATGSYTITAVPSTSTFTITVPSATYAAGFMYIGTKGVVRRITNLTADELNVILEIPQLTFQDQSTGDLHGNSVSFTIEVKPDADNVASVYQYIPTSWIAKKDNGTYTGTLVNIRTAGKFASTKVTGSDGLLSNPNTTQTNTTFTIGGGITGGVGLAALVNNATSTTLAAINGYTIFSETEASDSTVLDIGWKISSTTKLSETIGVYYRVKGTTTWALYDTIVFTGVAATTTNVGFWSIGGIGSGNTVMPVYKTSSITVSHPYAIYEFMLAINGFYSGTSRGEFGIISSSSNVKQYTTEIKGKTLSKYQKTIVVPLSSIGTGPWDVRVTRVSLDSTSANSANELWWSLYTEVIRAKLSYPNSALVYTAIDAQQFSSIPTRAFEIYGIKCKIPSNYDPYARTYTGFWDGTFKVDWTDNPAWVFYDLVSNTRYGLGDLVNGETLLDKWTLYTVAKYCDVMVMDGKGGYEPRFTANIYLQTKEDAFKVVSNLASIFRAMVLWSSGLVSVAQDSPRSVDSIYTSANVIDGKFEYTGTSAKTRHNTVLVTWNNPDNAYQAEIEYVEDTADITNNGVIKTEVVAMGCTSQGQAHRMGKWLLYTELHETEMVSFKTGLNGLLCMPGDVIKTQDPFRSGIRLGGRVVSAMSTSGKTYIEIDSPILFQVGKTYTFVITLPDGTIGTYSINNFNDNTEQTTIIIPSVLTNLPIVNSIWIMSVSTLDLQAWRVVSVSEIEKGQVEVTALSYRAEKFDAVEANLILRPLNVTNVLLNPTPVTNISIQEHMYQLAPGVLSNKVSISWEATSSGVQRYVISYKDSINNTNSKEITINDTTVEIEDLIESTYIFTIYTINSLGVKSAGTNITYTILGKTVPPASISNFTSTVINGLINLTWDAVADLDLKYYEIKIGSWGTDGSYLNRVYLNTNTKVILSPEYSSGVAHTFYIKAIDTSGNYSIAPTSTTLSILVPPAPIALPTSPTNLAYSFSGGNLVVNWTAPVITGNRFPIAKYNIYFGQIGAIIKIDETSATTYTIPWNYPAGSRNIEIEAVDTSGNGSSKLVYSVTVVAPSAPTNPIAVMKDTKVMLSWSYVANVGVTLPIEFYEIREGGANWGAGTVVAVIPAATSTLQYLYGIVSTTDVGSGTPPVGIMRYGGVKTFRIASKDSAGTYSATQAEVNVTITKPSAPSGFTLNVLDAYINSSWTPIITGTASDIYTATIDRYEIRYTTSTLMDEATWTAATPVSSLSGSSIQFDPPFNTIGTIAGNKTGIYYYIIRAYDTFNTPGSMSKTSITIDAPSAPVGLINKIIDNNVLLSWNEPITHTFPINTFILKKSTDTEATYDTATTIGKKAGGFTTVFEDTSARYKYILAGIDTAGNIGTITSTIAFVNQPPDYSLSGDITRYDFSITSYGSVTVSSTLTNLASSNALGDSSTYSIIGPMSPTETVTQHFTNTNANSAVYPYHTLAWNTPQDQISAGFTGFAQPTMTSGNLVEVYDYQTVFNSNQYVSINAQILNLLGTTGTYQIILGTSSDNSTYTYVTSALQVATAPTLSFGTFAIGFRYVKVQILLGSTATGVNVGKDLIKIESYRLQLSIKYTNDSGAGTVGTTGITTIALGSGGTLYTSPPTVSISGGGGTGAQAYTTISGGAVTGIVVTNSGSGYTTTPTVSLIGGGGSGYSIGTVGYTTAITGCKVSFNYKYIDVNSIQVTYGGTSPAIAIYDFVDVTYPTTFTVLLFDNTGAPTTGNFSWSAKGTV